MTNHDMPCESNSRRFHPLAIVGMGSLFPKADGLQEFWNLIRNGVDAITDVPPTHWRPEDYFDPDPKRPDFTYARRGGFLNPQNFDPMKFGIPPASLDATDTAQLLGMAVADQAMRDAGYGPEREFDRRRVSVILGVTGALELVVPLGARLGHPIWRKAMIEAGVDAATADDAVRRIAGNYPEWQENSFPGLLGNVVAGRISKFLNTGGTNCVVDAACASSLSAVHLSALELASGKADMAVTGGVDTFNDIFMYMCFSKTPALSPGGDARPFDTAADGTTLGEGVGVVVLKRLEDAERDGDRVYAVIKGIGSSSDGRGEAIYAPSASGQVRALRDAYEQAGVSPDWIQLVEAHGTGTKRGDAVEISALAEVFGQPNPKPWCAVGSIKSQIGHTKAAAGAAGMIKAALALHNKVLPPTIKVGTPAEAVAPGKTAFYVNTAPRPWISSGAPRTAAVSSFGFGGSNFHLVLEEHGPGKTVPDWDGSIEIAAFSADTRDGLRAAAGQFPFEAPWTRIQASAAQARARFTPDAPHRLAAVLRRGHSAGATVERVIDSAEAGTTFSASPDGAVFYSSGAHDGSVAVLFPGQGAQYVGMLRDITCVFPEALRVLSNADAACTGLEGGTLSERVFPAPAFDDGARAEQLAALTDTRIAQPAIGAVSLAAYRTLQRFGLRSSAVAGHSYGELTALCAAGRLDEADFLRLSKLRGALMAAGEGDRGGMLAVKMSPDAVEELIRSRNLDVVVANRNAPDQAVLSGSTSAIAKALDAVKGEGIACTRLPVSAAFHSPLVADAAGPFSEALEAVDFTRGDVPVYANTTACKYPDDAAAGRALLANQLAKPVEFVRLIEHMYADGVRTFLEAGPGARLTGLAGSILGGKPHQAFALDRSNGRQSGLVDLAQTLARLAALGAPVGLEEWNKDIEVAAESDAPAARMTVAISGANYRRPGKVSGSEQQAQIGNNVSPAPSVRNPEKKMDAEQVKTSAAASPVKGPESSGAEQSQMSPIPTVPDVNSAAGPLPAGPLADLFQRTQENIRGLQAMQEQTAKLHAQYLQYQEQAGRSYSGILAQQRQLLDRLSGENTAPVQPSTSATPVGNSPQIEPSVPAQMIDEDEPVEATPGAEHAAPATDALPVLLEIISDKTGYPIEMLTPDMTLDADLGIDSIKRVEILSALGDRVPELPQIDAARLGSIQTIGDVVEQVKSVQHIPGASEPAVDVATERSRESFTDAVLAVVADKTGYPVEMLEGAMRLDADLGIDSIKRVEILSAVQEECPELPDFPAETLAGLETLDDVFAIAESARVTPAAPEGPAVETGLEAVLFAVIADKTGYPVDMLEGSMALDADLGIDSIKRVEILSAVQERFPQLPEPSAETLTSLRTIQDALDAFDGASAGAYAAPESRPASAPARGAPPPAPLQRLTLEVRPVAMGELAAKISPPPNASIAITRDDAGVADALAHSLSGRGFNAIVIDVREPRLPDPLDGLIVLAPEDGRGVHIAKSAFRLVQEAAPRLRGRAEDGDTFFATISRMDGSFGLSGESGFDPVSGALAGIAKTAGVEWPGVHCKAVDLARGVDATDVLLDRLVDAVLAKKPGEIGLSARATVTTELRDGSLDASTTPEWSDSDVIVLTGGARGVTAAAALAIARSGGPALALLGRSDLPAEEPDWLADVSSESRIKEALFRRADGQMLPRDLEAACRRIVNARAIRETLEAVREAGARAEYYQADVQDAGTVETALGQVRAAFGPITGVVHGAGVIVDRMIEDQSFEDFARVYDTKVLGFEALERTTRDDPLRFFAVFSSSSARYGRKGQAAYAAANECANKMAQRLARARRACHVAAINWGPWDGGMVTPALAGVFRSEGIGLIGLEDGARHFLGEIAAPAGGPVESVVFQPGPKSAAAGTLSPASQPDAHPLSEASLTVLVEPGRHLFLRSHVLDGQAVLPVSMYVEWLAHAALHSHPGQHFQGVDDLRVFKGVILNGSQPLALAFYPGAPEASGAQLRVPVEMRSDEGRTLHSRGKVLLSSDPIAGEPELDIDRLSPYPHAVTELYGNGLLFHGEHFQGIEAVSGYAEDGISVTTRIAPPPAKWIRDPLRRHWLADPLVLDCAFQAAILWSRQRFNMASLPVRIGAYRQYAANFGPGPVEVVLRVTDATEHRATASIEFRDTRTGRLVARIHDYECILDASLDGAFARNRTESAP